MRLRRIFLGGCFVMPLLFCLYGCLVAGDYGGPHDPPVPILWQAFLWFCALMLWPFLVASLLFHLEPMSVFWFVLWLVTGLFWGLMIELVYVAGKRLRPNTARACVKTPGVGVD